jgi:ElaA protein
MSLRWTWQRFADLGVDGVYDMLQLRAKVFVLEQGPYLDADGVDRQSWHLCGRDEGGAMRAYLRVVDPGLKYAEPSMGRVAVEREWRRRGLGHELVAEGLKRALQAWPGHGNRISAQAHLDRFYARHGFVAVGEPYLEDNLPHLQMWRAP